MPRIPKITIQRWTGSGPAYTIHRSSAGWRNRQARRAGLSLDELVGDHRGAELDPGRPEHFLIFVDGETELWAYRRGHKYVTTLLVDGDAMSVMVDASEDDRIETYGPDLSLLGVTTLPSGDELEQPSNVSDGAESQDELDPDEEASEEDETAQTAALLEAALTPGTPEHDEVLASLESHDLPNGDLVTAQAAEQLEEQSEVGDASEEVSAEEESTSEDDFDGTIAELIELAGAIEDDELLAIVSHDSRKGAREAAQHEIDRRQAAIDADATAALAEGDPED